MAKVQIGISVDPSVHDEIQRLADRKGMTRPQFMVHLAQEAIRADLDGRPLFQPTQLPQPPLVEPGLLVRLTGELAKLVDRLKTVLRAHDQRDAELARLAQTNADAIREAQQQLAARLRDWLDGGIDPYSQKMDKLAAVVTQQAEVSATMMQKHCDALAHEMMEHPVFKAVAAELKHQRQAIETARPNMHFHVGANWHFSGLTLLGWLAGAFVTSFLVLVFFARSLPADWIAAPVATMLLGNEERAICVISGNLYTASGKCITPVRYAS